MLTRPSNRFDARDLWQKDHDHFLHPWTHFDSFKKEGSMVVVEGEGRHIVDVNGKRYLDGLGGMWCVNVGYGRNELAEAMAEIEEDMLSKVKKNLTHYLDQLEKETYDDGQRNKDATPDLDRLSKKERQYRDMIEKAVSAIDAAEAVEEDDVDAVDNAITTGNAIGNEFGRMIGQAPTVSENDYELSEPETDHAVQDVVDVAAGQPQQPVKVMEIGPGCVFEVYELGECDYEIRRGNRPLPTRFKSAEDADIAMKLFKSHHNRQQRDSNADYIEER